MDASDLWKIAGCPRNGPLFLERNHTHLQYKRAIRISKRESDCSISESLSEGLLLKDPDKFWKSWNKIESRNSNVSCIDDNFKHADIADAFASTFSNVYRNYDESAESNLRDRFNNLHETYLDMHKDDDISPYFISWSEFLLCISKIKTGKATGSFIKPQHVLHGPPLLAMHLHLMFNSFIQHEYVPTDFLSSIVSPIIKDTSGDHSDSKNYRPITLSHLFSQLFEHAISLKIGHLLTTDPLQFGFKPKHSTTHALFVLKETVDYFTNHGSNVLVSFLDCSKAFDKVSHNGLFLKLIERGVPLCFVNLLIYWMSNLSSRCRWRSALSDPFYVTSGVKQGGILSPNLFTMYVDDLLLLLRNSGVGCHVLSLFAAAIMFADDLALLAPTRESMQLLIGICEKYCKEYCLTFNTKKTKSLLFGKNYDTVTFLPCNLNNESIEIVHKWKYLGCHICSGKELVFSGQADLFSFRRSANSIVSVLRKPSEQVSMTLLYTFAVPILTYAAEVKLFPNSEMNDCHVALNDAIRRIFGYNRWESIRTLREGLGYLDITSLFAKRRQSFRQNIPRLRNILLSTLLNLD